MMCNHCGDCEHLISTAAQCYGDVAEEWHVDTRSKTRCLPWLHFRAHATVAMGPAGL